MKKFILITAVLLCGNIIWAADAQMFKLDNGQTVVIQEVHNNPIVTIDTWIKTGSIDEDDSNNGVAHFLEHLFFKGTKNHAPGEFDRILETKGAIIKKNQKTLFLRIIFNVDLIIEIMLYLSF